MESLTALILPILQITWINLLLSGDNAVVIALACRNLAASQRRMGMLLGAAAAILLRIAFTLITSSLVDVPFVKLFGSAFLFWIALKLLGDDHVDPDKIAGESGLWKAVQTIAIADIVMSLDNVIAVVAIANGHTGLIIFSLVISIPLVLAGSQILLSLIQRFPVIVWLGAGLLGWVAGQILSEDAHVIAASRNFVSDLRFIAPGTQIEIGILPLAGAASVLFIGLIQHRLGSRA